MNATQNAKLFAAGLLARLFEARKLLGSAIELFDKHVGISAEIDERLERNLLRAQDFMQLLEFQLFEYCEANGLKADGDEILAA